MPLDLNTIFNQQLNQRGEDMAVLKNQVHQFVPVNFGDMLEATGRVKARMPLDVYSSYRPDGFTRNGWAHLLLKNEFTARRVQDYYKAQVCREYAEILKGRNLVPNWELRLAEPLRAASEADFMRSFCAAFKVVFGHSFKSAANFLKGKAISSVGKNNFYAIHYLKKIQVKDFVLANDESLSFALKENKALALLAMNVGVVIENKNYQQTLKEKLKDKWGFSDADWRFLCQQSQSYIIRGMRSHILYFAVKNRLKDAHIRNPFIRKAKMVHPVMNRVLQAELRRYKGPACKFSPFEVVNRGYLLNAYQCRELQMIRDYLHYHDGETPINATTFGGLFRQAEQWHNNEEARRQARYEAAARARANLPPPHNGPFTYEGVADEYEVDGVKFVLVKDTETIIAEGMEMHHCVGSYNQQCGDKQYMVFKVFGSERATLGCRISDGEVYFNQLYGHCNKYVSDTLHDAAYNLLKKVNADIQQAEKQKEALAA